MTAAVFIIVGTACGILTAVYFYRQEQKYADKKKKDTDKNWFISHLFLLAVFVVLLGYLIKEEGFKGNIDYFVLACSIYLIILISTDTVLQRGRYIFYDKNHIYVSGRSLISNKNYSVKRNRIMLYYDLEGIRINRKQLCAIDEVLKEKGFRITVD